MKKGSLIFVKGDSLISKIINKLDGKYSHVAIALSDSTILEAQRFTYSRIITNYHRDYVEIPLSLTEDQLNQLAERAIELIGYEYDYDQIFNIFTRYFINTKRKNSRQKFICSELIVQILKDIGYLSKYEYEEIVDWFTPNVLHDYIKKKEEHVKELN